MKHFLLGILVLFLRLVCGVFLFADQRGTAKELVLDFTGDIMAHVDNLIVPDYEVVYQDISDLLKDDDLGFANLEFVIDETTPITGYPRFNVHKEYVEAAINSGLNVFSVANNHTYDFGVGGVFQTLRTIEGLKEEYGDKVWFSGIRGNTLDDFKPVIISVKGIKVGFVAVTQFLNRLEKSPYVFMADYRKYSDRERLIRYVGKWAGRFDVFILSYHGGREYSLKPDRMKIDFFHALIRSGVDVVYSHHPHVVQRFELVRKSGFVKLILYSTGNLVSGMVGKAGTSYTSDSAVFRVFCEIKNHKSSVRKVEPVLITNLRGRDGVIVIKRFKEVLKERELSDVFYLKRYVLLKKVLQGKGK